MFSRLPESNAPRQRRTGGLVVSTAVHVVVIALAVRATTLEGTPAPFVAPLPPIYTVPEPSLATPSSSRRSTSGTAESIVPRPPAPIPVLDLSSTTIPDDGVPIDLTRPGDFKSNSVVTVTDAGTGTPNADGNGPFAERSVEKVVVALPGTEPRYPSMLQSAGVEGDVRAQFVVDTLGRVEQGSVHVLAATHDLFAAAVRDALGRARFKPAEAGGHKVRQLAEQTFTFRLGVR